MGYAFISYSTQNTEIAFSLRALLEKHNIDSWIAPNNIPAGYRYAQVINQAVRQSSCLILLLSESSQNSSFVAKEVERAIHYRKLVLPVQIDNVVLNDEFEFYISTNQIVSIRTVDEGSEEIQKLLASVTTCVNQPTPDDPRQDFPIAPTRHESLPEKTLIDGKYEVLSFEGDAGDTAVYRVRHKYSGTTAILLLFPNIPTQVELTSQLFRRADTSGLGELIDIVQTRDSIYWIFRDSVGQSLSEHLVQNYEMEETAVVSMGIQLCQTLLYLEQRYPEEILDAITAANIFVKGDGTYTIIPTGFKKRGAQYPTLQNLNMGERFYYAPEKLQTGISDPSTIIYALGAVLYAAVVGRDPARQPHVFYPLRKRHSTLSQSLEQIITKCMDPNPKKRFSSIRQLHKQLTRLSGEKTKPSLFSFFKRNASK